MWEARPGVCIYASESEVIYNSATESVPCGSVDDGLTYNCLCNDVNLAEEKTEKGCHCRYGWTGSSDDLRCEEFCCNPDSDPGGNWCIVADEECQGSQWGCCHEVPGLASVPLCRPRSHMTFVDCQDSCRRAPQCTGVEWPLDDSYCFFWLRGACNAGKAGHVPSGWNIDYDYQTCSWQHHVANYSLASLVFVGTFVCTDEEVHFRIHVDEWPSHVPHSCLLLFRCGLWMWDTLHWRQHHRDHGDFPPAYQERILTALLRPKT